MRILFQLALNRIVVVNCGHRLHTLAKIWAIYLINHHVFCSLSFQRRHNEHHGVSNHQPHYCTQPFIQAQIRENTKASLAFVRGIHRWPVNSPHKGPVTRKVFSFDDVIMSKNDMSGPLMEYTIPLHHVGPVRYTNAGVKTCAPGGHLSHLYCPEMKNVKLRSHLDGERPEVYRAITL